MSKKIVINKCYGGFGLSPIALEAYAKRKGIEKLYWFNSKPKDYPSADFEYTPTDVENAGAFSHAYTTSTRDEETFFSKRDPKRDDPDLVAVVEEFGNKANTRFSELKIVEIPDDVEWTIEEYDGIEWVSEIHRTWG